MNIEDALSKIARAKDENATFLDLGDLGLTELPNELFELKQLEFLNLGRRYIQDFKEVKTSNQGERNILKWMPWKFRRLKNLKGLSLHATYTGDVSGLKELRGLQYLDLAYNTFIRDYSQLNMLGNLEILNLGSNDLRDLSFVWRLKNLRYLDIGYNYIKDLEFLQELQKIEVLIMPDVECTIDICLFGHLSHLKSLSAGSNLLSNLDAFEKLPQLEHLNLFDSKLKDASFTSPLKNLRSLSLWINEITEVAPISELPLLTHLNLRENAIKNIDALQKLRNLQLLDVGVNHLIDKNIEKDFDFVNILKTERNLYNG